MISRRTDADKQEESYGKPKKKKRKKKRIRIVSRNTCCMSFLYSRYSSREIMGEMTTLRKGYWLHDAWLIDPIVGNSEGKSNVNFLM